MDILIVYATNSGATLAATQIVQNLLTQASHTVEVKPVVDTTPEDIQKASHIIFASPSWDFDGKEGMPHEDYVPIMEKVKGGQMNGKQIAILGLGDSSYTKFCGAVDHLEAWIKDNTGTLVQPSLRIDGYYFKPENAEKVSEWGQKLLTAFT